jgi:peptidoglycan/LPS O-acetylase OafA/YrhL
MQANAERVTSLPVVTRAGEVCRTGGDFRLGYRPSLDGLRAVAILAVLAVHTIHVFGWSVLRGGSLGVDIFFVLSGFLITSLLLEEWGCNGRIGLKNFYRRRALRLVPVLLTMLCVLYFTAHVFLAPGEAELTVRAIPVAFLYLSDLAIAFGDNVQLGVLKHTWSLAVEEQFYLLWPPLLYLALKSGMTRHTALGLTLMLLAVAVLHRFALWEGPASVARTYYSIDTRADALLVGCAAGMALSWGFVRSCPAWLMALAVLTLELMLLFTDYATPFMHRGGFTLAAVATACVIAGVLLRPSGLLHAVLENRALVWIGRVSYGLYLWHYPAFKAAKYLSAPSPVKLVVALALTFATAALSFYLIEKPILLLKSRYAPSPAKG